MLFIKHLWVKSSLLHANSNNSNQKSEKRNSDSHNNFVGPARSCSRYLPLVIFPCSLLPASAIEDVLGDKVVTISSGLKPAHKCTDFAFVDGREYMRSYVCMLVLGIG